MAEMRDGGVDERDADKMTGIEALGFFIANNVTASQPGQIRLSIHG